MSDGPVQPDEPAFPRTEEALRLLATAALSAEVRARHLHAIRLRAAELGDAPLPQGAASETTRAVPRSSGLSTLRWRGRRAAAVAGVWLGSLSLGTGVAAAASMDDVPGDALYGLKRAVEAVQLHLPGDTQTDVQRRLALSQRRLEEAEALRARGATDALLVEALGEARRLLDDAGALAAGDEALEAEVAGSASRARTRLTQLLGDGLPDEAADRAREAIEAATERAEERRRQRAEDERGRGRDDDERATTPGTPRPSEDDDEADDEGDDEADDDRRRRRGRGEDDEPSSESRGSPTPSEVEDQVDDEGDDDDEDASSAKGRPSHAGERGGHAGGQAEHQNQSGESGDDAEDEPDDDESEDQSDDEPEPDQPDEDEDD